MSIQELIDYNIRQGIGLFLNTYYDEVNTEPASLDDWVSYVYHEITNNFSSPEGWLEMGNKVLRFQSEIKLKDRIKELVLSDEEVKKYMK